MHTGGKPGSITSRGCGSQPHCQFIDMMENSFSSARFPCLKNQSSPFQSPNLSLVLALLSEEGLTFPPVQEEMGVRETQQMSMFVSGMRAAAPYFSMQGPGALGCAAPVEREHNKEGDQ